MEKKNSDSFDFHVEPLEEGEFELDGKTVGIVIFESVKEGEIIKISTEDHSLGISAEYAWINYKYPGYERSIQTLTIINLNGRNVECDVLTIENEKDKKDIFFDISDFYYHPFKDDKDHSWGIVLERNIDNKILFTLHKMTGESISILKNKIKKGQAVLTCKGTYSKHMEAIQRWGGGHEDSNNIVDKLIVYLNENKIEFKISED